MRFASGKGGFPSNKQQNKRTLLNNATYLYLQLDRKELKETLIMSKRLIPKGMQTDEEESERENFTSNPHETTEAPQDGRIYTLLHPLAVWYFVFTGQWFDPVRLFLESKLNLTPSATKLCRSLYAAWQAIVVLFIWAFFVYSMGFMGLRTLKEVNWLCPLTDIKNMAYGFFSPCHSDYTLRRC